MKHLSLFTGYGGFDIACQRQGIESIGFSEIEKSACALLRYRFPQVPNLGDIQKIIIDSNDNVWYPSINGATTIKEICRDSGFIQSGIVDSRYSEYVRSNKASNARKSESEGCEIQKQQEVWTGKSLLQGGNKSKRQKSEFIGESNREGGCETENSLRDMQGHGRVQRRKNENTGSPLGLQPTTQSDVAMSKMPPQMAQGKQSNTINSIKETRQNDDIRYSKLEDFELLTGGFP